MTIDLRTERTSSSRGWIARWFRGKATSTEGTADDCHLRNGSVKASNSAIRPAIREWIEAGRSAFVLSELPRDELRSEEIRAARRSIERSMALIPSGDVPMIRSDGSAAVAHVATFHLDRYPVTNLQYQSFLEAGCYDDLEIWPRDIWPSLLRFCDRTGQPGPAGWSHGRFPPGKADHPVVGVGWHEAAAYARWVGKRLPTAIEWQKAGGWPEQLDGGSCTRYPWGDLFDPSRANLWMSKIADTVAVTEFRSGDTPNGIHQMSGNVWEWLDDPLDAIPAGPGEVFRPWRPMRRIVGGAFDTYLPSEATCHFITGQPELDRRHNIGFRCAVSEDRLAVLDENGAS